MKVIYEANDGTKFESEFDCKKYETTQSFYDMSNKIEELLDIADREQDSYLYTKRNITDFIIENISKINEALNVRESKYTFIGKEGENYYAVNDPDNSCTKCSFKYVKHVDGENCCNSKEEFDCRDNEIIWIKK